jgi:ParB-like chromosome segregation protein Spo0J
MSSTVDLYQTTGTSPPATADEAHAIGPPNPFPPLSPEEHAALRTSIERYGVLIPIVSDVDGNILDGHHRLAIATELGVTYPVIVAPEDADPDDIARTLNLDRRHLTVEQRRAFVAELRAKGTSVRGIAKATGAPRSTVADDIKKQVSGSGHVTSDAPVMRNFDTPPKVIGKDGKSYPASKPKRPKAKTRKQTKVESRALLEEIAERVSANTPKALRETAKQAAIAYIESEANGWTHFDWLYRELREEYGTS